MLSLTLNKNLNHQLLLNLRLKKMKRTLKIGDQVKETIFHLSMLLIQNTVIKIIKLWASHKLNLKLRLRLKRKKDRQLILLLKLLKISKKKLLMNLLSHTLKMITLKMKHQSENGKQFLIKKNLLIYNDKLLTTIIMNPGMLS